MGNTRCRNRRSTWFTASPSYSGGHFYKATFAQHELLAKMIGAALASGDPDERNLAVKNFFIFDQLFWLRGSEVHTHIAAEVESVLGRPVSDVKGTLSVFDFRVPEAYYQSVRAELQRLASGRLASAWGARQKEIDLRPLQLKATSITDFVHCTDACVPQGSTLGSSVQVYQVQGAVLNLRSQPTTESSTVRRLQQGELLRAVEVSGDWTQVLDQECGIGWVATRLVADARSALPVPGS